jgi:hypothetical protein
VLRNTLILPADNVRLAAQLLHDAIGDLDVVLMLIFGTGPDVTQIVVFADQLANKTRMDVGGNLRRVVWIADAAALEGTGEFPQLFADIRAKARGALPLAAVLNFHDKVMAAIAVDQLADPIKLELLFLEGHKL